MSLKFVVDKNGSGDYASVGEALEAAENNAGQAVVIYIKNGVYEEKLVVSSPNVTLIGEDSLKTIIRYNDGAFKLDENGEPIGTFNTASLHVLPSAEGFEAYSLTIENSAGVGSVAGQAVALYLDCDKAVIADCRLLARQDTLLTGPMYADIEKDPEIINRQYFKNCYIEGDVDYIFGGAAAVFEDCEIYSLDRPQDLPCYVTAACTSKLLDYGYVFRNCYITGNAADGSVFLGRPWREHANVVYIDCKMDKCVNKEGFHKWNDTQKHLTSKYMVYNCSGEGYSEDDLAEWCKVLGADDAQKYETQNVFGDWKYGVQDYKGMI